MGLDDLIQIGPFGIPQLAEFIHKRISSFEWSGKLADFITEDALAGLVLATDGNPRMILQVLRNAMDVANEKRRNYPLKIESIRDGLNLLNKPEIDDTDFAILMYIRRAKSVYPSDKKFVSKIGGSASNLSRRCRALKEVGVLDSTTVKKGQTRQEVYSYPIIDHNY